MVKWTPLMRLWMLTTSKRTPPPRCLSDELTVQVQPLWTNDLEMYIKSLTKLISLLWADAAPPDRR